VSSFGDHVEFEMAHAIPPDDDFVHVEDWSCACNPYIHAVPWVGAAVIHRRVDAGPVPDALPEGFE
jgi:hypothetical protein